MAAKSATDERTVKTGVVQKKVMVGDTLYEVTGRHGDGNVVFLGVHRFVGLDGEEVDQTKWVRQYRPYPPEVDVVVEAVSKALSRK